MNVMHQHLKCRHPIETKGDQDYGLKSGVIMRTWSCAYL